MVLARTLWLSSAIEKKDFPTRNGLETESKSEETTDKIV
jgi:hypothetical protein